MIQLLTKIIPESESGLFGLGKVTITYWFDKSEHYFNIRLESGYAIEYKGIKAIELCEKYFIKKGKNKQAIEAVKRLAAISCQTTVDKMMTANEKGHKRGKEEVFARFLVMWYAMKKMGMTCSDSAKIFSKDHATTIYAVKSIDKNDKYKKPEQIEMQKHFFELIGKSNGETN